MGRPLSKARIAAKESGLKSFQGTPCVNCGTHDKYTSNGSCVKCAKALAAEKRRTRPDRARFVLETVKGPECKKCGTFERYLSNGQCVKCKRESQARSRAAKKGNR